jgi:hypothetical protein
MHLPNFLILIQISEQESRRIILPIPLFLVGLFLNIGLLIGYITLKVKAHHPDHQSLLNTEDKAEPAKQYYDCNRLIQERMRTFAPRDLWTLNRLYKAIRCTGRFHFVDIRDSKGNHISIRFI